MSPRRIAKVLGLIGGVAIGAILIVTVWVVRHRTTEETLVSAAGLLPTALLHARNFHWTQMKGGASQWVLTAKDASYSTDKTTITLTDAHVAMIATDGKQTSLAAPTASLTLNGNHVNRAQLNGGVVVHYGDYVLTTDQAVFQPDADQIDAPGAVKIEGQGLTVTGTGMTGHPKAEVFELLKEVSTQIVPAKKGATAKVS
jgi:lipopolysaccharide export system protein LptC